MQILKKITKFFVEWLCVMKAQLDGKNHVTKVFKPKDFPKRMTEIIKNELQENSYLMPDGRYIPPDECLFTINPSDYSKLQFLIPRTEKQLIAQASLILSNQKNYNSTALFHVKIKADPGTSQGDIKYEFTYKVIFTPIAKNDCVNTIEKKALADIAMPIADADVYQDVAGYTIDCAMDKTEEFISEKNIDVTDQSTTLQKKLNLVILRPGKCESIFEGDIITITASKPDIIVGRKPTADVVLSYPFIGADQFRLIFDKDDTFIQNLGITNPTSLNGTVLQGDSIALLRKHDKIKIADFCMAVGGL